MSEQSPGAHDRYGVEGARTAAAYSVKDIREIIKRAPRLSDSPILLPGEIPPEYYLTAHTLEDFSALCKTFLTAVRRSAPLSIDRMERRVKHEGEHGEAIIGLNGVPVYELVVYKPEGFLDNRRYPFQLKTFAQGLDPDSMEFAVSTGYPEELSSNDLAVLKKRGLTVPDIDRIAVENGWPRPLSLQRNENS